MTSIPDTNRAGGKQRRIAKAQAGHAIVLGMSRSESSESHVKAPSSRLNDGTKGFLGGYDPYGSGLGKGGKRRRLYPQKPDPLPEKA
jgi:hypothetical protein